MLETTERGRIKPLGSEESLQGHPDSVLKSAGLRHPFEDRREAGRYCRLHIGSSVSDFSMQHSRNLATC